MGKQLDGETGFTFSTQEETSHQIEQYLRRAMHLFVARWLPAVLQTIPGEPVQYEDFIKDRWRASRRDMLKAINRISYRSVLALYLFSQTPVPLGISEEEEMDGISAMVCTQTALLHLQQLRERLQNCQFNVSELSTWSDGVPVSPASFNFTQVFLDFESRAYWAAVTWDTSSSMILNFRSSLTSGLKGACLEPAWRLTRGFLVGSFYARSEDWRKTGFELSDEVASQIISAAAVCKTYTWKTIASVKEALREGVEEIDLLVSWNAVLDALEIFKITIEPLLNMCEKRLHFLREVDRLTWYEVVLHYYLGILILTDAVEAASRLDLISQLTGVGLNAEQKSFNVLKFGLESRYTICRPLEGSSNVSDGNLVRQPTTTSFIAIDPYPQHVIASVRLIKKAISRKYRQSNIKHEVYSFLSATLLQVLEQLPQSSKIVQSARKNLQESLQLDTISTSNV